MGGTRRHAQAEGSDPDLEHVLIPALRTLISQP
jgi:hypothetical protein